MAFEHETDPDENLFFKSLNDHDFSKSKLLNANKYAESIPKKKEQENKLYYNSNIILNPEFKETQNFNKNIFGSQNQNWKLFEKNIKRNTLNFQTENKFDEKLIINRSKINDNALNSWNLNEENGKKNIFTKYFSTEKKKIQNEKEQFKIKSDSYEKINIYGNFLKTPTNIKSLDFMSTKTDLSSTNNSDNFKINNYFNIENEFAKKLSFKANSPNNDLICHNKINSENKKIRINCFSNNRKNSDVLKMSKNFNCITQSNRSIKRVDNEIKTSYMNVNINKIPSISKKENILQNQLSNCENIKTTLKNSNEKGEENYHNCIEFLDEEMFEAKKKYSKSLLCSNTKTKKKFEVLIKTQTNDNKHLESCFDNDSFLNLQKAKNYLKSSIISQEKKKSNSSNSKNIDSNQLINSNSCLSNKSGNLMLNTDIKIKNRRSYQNEESNLTKSIDKKLQIENKINEANLIDNFINNSDKKYESIHNNQPLFYSMLNLSAKNNYKNNIFDLNEIDSIYNDDPLNITNEEQEELKLDILKLKDLIDSKIVLRFSNNNNLPCKVSNNIENTITNFSLDTNSKELNEYSKTTNMDINKQEQIYFKNKTIDWENYFNDKFIEYRLRNFYNKNKIKFNKKIHKGPPETFRWISWLITAKIPLDRNADFYNKFLKKELLADISSQIKKDIGRTFPNSIKKKYFKNIKIDFNLFRILKALAVKDQDVSYCQGMNFVVGFLLVVSNFNELETFYMMLSLLNYTGENNFGVRGFFTQDFPLLKLYLFIFQFFFLKKIPLLKGHFDKLDIPNELWISKWLQTLFTIVLPYDAVKRVWDCILTYGLDFIINFSIAYLKYLESDLLKLKDTIDIINFFKNLSPQKYEDEYEDLEELEKCEETFANFYQNEKQNDKSNNNSNSNSNPNQNRKNSLEEKFINNNNIDIKLNIEEIIQSAFKLNIKKSQFESLKKEFETLTEFDDIYSQNINIKELYEYKKTEINIEDDHEENHLFKNDKNDCIEKKMLTYINESAMKNEIDNEKTFKKIQQNNIETIDLKTYSENKSIPKKLNQTKITFPKILNFDDQIKSDEVNFNNNIMEREGAFHHRIFNNSTKKEILNSPSYKMQISAELDLYSENSNSILNEESNPININNLTNVSIDEMICKDKNKHDVFLIPKESFVNNIRNSIDSKNIGTIINKINPIIKENKKDS